MPNEEIKPEKELREEKPIIEVGEIKEVKEEIPTQVRMLEEIEGNFTIMASVPTHIPRTLKESIILYLSGTTYRIYWYIKDAWKLIYDSTWFDSRVRAYLGGNQTASDSTATKITLDTENYDGNTEFDSTTNYRFTAKTAGYYQVCAVCRVDDPIADKLYRIDIYKNGATVASCLDFASYAGSLSLVISDIVSLAIDDYLEFYFYHVAGQNQTINSGTTKTFMAIHKLS